LVTLNVSNNKFRQFPPAITHLEALRDLDVSFNMIAELPEEPGSLVGLERLVLVGNQIVRFPNELATGLKSLRVLDCRRNLISGLHVISMLPALHTLSADHNAVQSLNLAVGPFLATLDASHNEITQLELAGGVGVGGRLGTPYALTSLDISHAKLSSLDGLALGTLAALRVLRIDHNTFRSIPETLGELTELELLSCADNKLDALPSSIGKLGRLEELDAHNNCLTELPLGIWECGSLKTVNVTSNFLGVWADPPVVGEGAGWGWGLQSASTFSLGEFSVVGGNSGVPTGRKASAASIGGSSISTFDVVRMLPPLVNSLEKLYLGENRLTDDVLRTLMIFKELRIMNLSFNDLQDLPTNFLKNLTWLEELYLSGNKLTSIPTEDLHRMGRLSVLYLNGNRLQTLPQELGKVKSLTVLDVGSNLLKYNVNNWEFDWNWWAVSFCSYVAGANVTFSGGIGTSIRTSNTSTSQATIGCRSKQTQRSVSWAATIVALSRDSHCLDSPTSLSCVSLDSWTSPSLLPGSATPLIFQMRVTTAVYAPRFPPSTAWRTGLPTLSARTTI
jgi:adenylate cyclase